MKLHTADLMRTKNAGPIILELQETEPAPAEKPNAQVLNAIADMNKRQQKSE